MKNPNDDFRYRTFPGDDSEIDMLKLEAWLCRLWNGEDPAELLTWEQMKTLTPEQLGKLTLKELNFLMIRLAKIQDRATALHKAVLAARADALHTAILAVKKKVS